MSQASDANVHSKQQNQYTKAQLFLTSGGY